jgi:hypothetical protein
MTPQEILERAVKKQRTLVLDPIIITYIGDIVISLKKGMPSIIRTGLTGPCSVLTK